MALITSAQSGNFNDTATWTGGVVPGVGDEARAATGHTITINVNITCDEVSNEGTGIFIIATGITLTSNVTSKTATTVRTCLQFTAAFPASATIIGNVTSGSVQNAVAVANISSGTLNITGNVVAIGRDSAGVYNASTGTVNITGNIFAGDIFSSSCINNFSTGIINITGNVTGGSNTSFGIINSSAGQINIIGNVTGGSGNSGIGANNASTGIINITGNVTGGGGSGSVGVNNASTGTINIIGIATGGTTNGAAGANGANAAGIINVTRAKGNDFGIGSVGLAAGFGLLAGQTHIAKVKEIEYGSRGMSPTSGPVYLDPVVTNTSIFIQYPSGSKILSDPNNTAGLSPSASDVRLGIVYNNGINTGTLAVPPPAGVAAGVPTDNTVGTAVITLSAMTNVFGQLLADALGE